MNNTFRQMLQTLVPFLVLGVIIAFIAGLFIMFSYVLVWGIIIGAILWIIVTIKSYLFPSKTTTNTEGRIIEHNDPR